jgi:peptidyl-prolyl cis-trans isomerase B (cyclophilin B)
VPNNVQRREQAKRKLERQIARRAERAKRQRIIAVVLSVVAVLVVGGGVWFLATRGSSSGDAAAAPSSSAQAEGKKTGGPCAYAETPSEPAAKEAGLPDDPNPTPNTGTTSVSMKTDQGDIPLALDKAKAPCTVQSFTHLVQKKYYDGTPCHRLTTADSLKVLQCGDPKGTGQGGPGYTIKDEKPTDLKPADDGQASIYPRGTLAMAKTQAPDSGGSQFFLVYADSKLPPDYTVFGKISDAGMAVIDKVAAGGVQPTQDPQTGQPSTTDGKPAIPVNIQTATVVN